MKTDFLFQNLWLASVFYQETFFAKFLQMYHFRTLQLRSERPIQEKKDWLGILLCGKSQIWSDGRLVMTTSISCPHILYQKKSNSFVSKELGFHCSFRLQTETHPSLISGPANDCVANIGGTYLVKKCCSQVGIWTECNSEFMTSLTPSQYDTFTRKDIFSTP